MPLKDGTNAEKEDVQPPLGWKTKDDIKDVVLHEQKFSPPCTKIRLFLAYHKVPYTPKKGKKKGSEYNKIPVLLASGRQINDSYIILKNLVPVLSGEPFNDEWQDKITYKLQIAIEIETFQSVPDATKFAAAVGIPKCIGCCLVPIMAPKILNKFRNDHPNTPPSAEIGKEFAAAIGGKEFFHGHSPGQVDLAYYGTILSFKKVGTQVADDHLRHSGLEHWWGRMEKHMPNVF